MMREFWVGPMLNNGKKLLVYQDECSEDNPCGFCRGDCDSDDDCEGSLKCYHRVGYEQVPFCTGEGVFGTDYCTIPYKEKVYEEAKEKVYTEAKAADDDDEADDYRDTRKLLRPQGNKSSSISK